ncbi:type VII secretion integral membrane protein EccD [Actinoplanes sp. NPDC000266]
MSRPGNTEPATRTLVTVVGARSRADLAVPSQAPIAEYSDRLAGLLGEDTSAALPPAWSLAPAGAAPLPIESSLAEAGVADGTVLYLRDVLAGEGDEPVVRGVWEVVEEVGDAGLGPRWDARARARAAVLLGAVWLLATLSYLGFNAHGRSAAGAVLAVAGIGFAVTARIVGAHPRVLPDPLRTALGCAAVPAMTVVALLTLGPGLLYAEIGAVVGLLIALSAVPGVLLAAVTLVAAIAGVMTTVVLALGASTTAAAATAVVAGVLFAGVAPRTAGALTAATWLRLSSPSMEPSADPDELARRVTRAQHTLVLLMAIASAIVAVGLIVVTRDPAPFPLALAGVAVVALLVRAGTFSFATEAIGPVLAALAGAFGLFTALGHWPVTEPLRLPLAALAGVAAVGVAVPVLLWRSPAAAAGAPKWRPLLTVCQLALPPLLLGVYGVFGLLWGLGRNF